MGLFDIFRRRAKKHKQESAVKSEVSESEQSLSVASTNEQSVASTQSEASQSAEDSQSTTESNTSSQSTSVESSQSTSTTESTSESTSESIKNSSVSEEPLTSSLAAKTITSQSSVEASVTPEQTNEATISSTEQATTEATASSNEPTSSAATTPAEGGVSSESSDEEEKEKKYDRGLAKSRHGFGARLNAFLANFRHVDEDFFDDLEDLLIESDVGYEMTMKLSDELREEVKLQNAKSKQEVSNVIIEKMVDLYEEAGKGENPDINFAKEGPTVIMFVGVNGAGKTTTIGKMAAMYKRQGKKVLLAAADTFRAGAVEQLDVWAKRDGVDIVKGPVKGDPAAVVYDAVKKAKDENYDILFVDTAGRLQNKVNLMKELNKMKRVLTREIPEAPHEVLLVLDATTGQNALTQAKDFQETTDVTGIVLTKLDGTARGGIVLAIRNELHLPVKYVGLGEHVDDLQKFDANEFVYGLFKGLVTPEEK